jgi:hypothetical protein
MPRIAPPLVGRARDGAVGIEDAKALADDGAWSDEVTSGCINDRAILDELFCCIYAMEGDFKVATEYS